MHWVSHCQTLSVHACPLSLFSGIQLFATPWTVVHQAPLPMGFSRQKYWSRWPWPPPGDLPNPGIKPASVCLLPWQADSLPLHHLGSPWVCISPLLFYQSKILVTPLCLQKKKQRERSKGGGKKEKKKSKEEGKGGIEGERKGKRKKEGRMKRRKKKNIIMDLSPQIEYNSMMKNSLWVYMINIIPSG